MTDFVKSFTLAIDPGLDGTGYAVFENASASHMPPTHVGVARLNPGLPFVIRAHSYADWLREVIHTCDKNYGPISRIVCEWPNSRYDAVGQAATAEGSIQKLCYLIGTFGEIAVHNEIVFTLITVPEWKGQLPKAVVTSRIIELFGVDVCEKLKIKTHAWDAVGIGLYAKGYRFTGLHS